MHAAVKDRCCILGLDWYSHHVNLDTSVVASLVRLRVILSPRLSTEHSFLSRWGSFVATVETVQCHCTVPVHVSQGEGFGYRRRSCKRYVDVVYLWWRLNVHIFPAQKAMRELKTKISTQSKRNFVLEKDVRYLDSRIALLIQNRLEIEEVII